MYKKLMFCKKKNSQAEASEDKSVSGGQKVELKVKVDAAKAEKKVPKKKAERSPKEDPFKKFIKVDEEKKSKVPLPKEKSSVYVTTYTIPFTSFTFIEQ